MEEKERDVSAWSLRDQLGCFGLYLLFWLPFTLFSSGFAPTLPGFVAGVFEGAAQGEVIAIVYLLASVPAFVLPILIILSMFRAQ